MPHKCFSSPFIRVSFRPVNPLDPPETVSLQIMYEGPIVEGDNVTLKCQADGNPVPTSFFFHIKVSQKPEKYFRKNVKSARGASLKVRLLLEDCSFKDHDQSSLWRQFCFYNTSLWCEMIFLSIRTRKCWWRTPTLTPWIASAEMLPVNTDALCRWMRKWRHHISLLWAVSSSWHTHTHTHAYSMNMNCQIFYLA